MKKIKSLLYTIATLSFISAVVIFIKFETILVSSILFVYGVYLVNHTPVLDNTIFNLRILNEWTRLCLFTLASLLFIVELTIIYSNIIAIFVLCFSIVILAYLLYDIIHKTLNEY